jgi:chromosome partitioning protein
MRTICLASAKGGVGKSTLAASLGVAALQAGEKPYLIDMDPQKSLLSWGSRRTADDLPVDKTDAPGLPGALANLASAGYTLAIIDTAGVDNVTAAAAMTAANLVIIPARPSTLDLEASRPTLAALARLDRPYAFVLNACAAGRSSRIEDASRALSLLGVLAIPPIVQRADHVDAIGLGLGVTEMNTDGKAAAEMIALWAWINRRMEEKDVEKAVA